MKTLQVLYYDWQLADRKTASAIAAEYDLEVFCFGDDFRRQLASKNALAMEIKAEMNEGKPVSGAQFLPLLNQFFDKAEGPLLIKGFPRSENQIPLLREFLKQHSLKLEKAWYFRQKNPHEFRQKHFASKHGSPWAKKFGQEVLDFYDQKFPQKAKEIQHLQNLTPDWPWQTVLVDFDEDITVKKLRNQIPKEAESPST